MSDRAYRPDVTALRAWLRDPPPHEFDPYEQDDDAAQRRAFAMVEPERAVLSTSDLGGEVVERLFAAARPDGPPEDIFAACNTVLTAAGRETVRAWDARRQRLRRPLAREIPVEQTASGREPATTLS